MESDITPGNCNVSESIHELSAGGNRLSVEEVRKQAKDLLRDITKLHDDYPQYKDDIKTPFINSYLLENNKNAMTIVIKDCERAEKWLAHYIKNKQHTNELYVDYEWTKKKIKEVCMKQIFKPIPDHGIDVCYFEESERDKKIAHCFQVKHGETDITYSSTDSFSVKSIAVKLIKGLQSLILNYSIPKESEIIPQLYILKTGTGQFNSTLETHINKLGAKHTSDCSDCKCITIKTEESWFKDLTYSSSTIQCEYICKVHLKECQKKCQEKCQTVQIIQQLISQVIEQVFVNKKRSTD